MNKDNKEIEREEEEVLEGPFCDKQLVDLLAKGPLLTFAEQTRYWLTGFSSSAGITLVRLNKRGAVELHVYFDKRYMSRAKAEIGGARIRFYDSVREFVKFIRQQEFTQILIEGEYATLKDVKQIQGWVGPFCKIIEITGQELRKRKSLTEIQKIEEAVKISLEAYRDIRLNKLRVGVSEIEIARALNIKMLELGADSEAFSPIIAFGKNTASPHHKPGDNKLVAGDIVTMDFGAKFSGYCSDITRTFIYPGIGEGDEFKRLKLARIYQIVEEAAALGRAAVKPGVRAGDIHKICSDHIASEGYLDNFVHATGHGVGLDVHEKPTVSQGEDYILESGNVITVEPGIYIDGLGGVRIEDTIVVVEGGAKILSRPYLYGDDTYPSQLDEYSTDLERLSASKKTAPKKRSENLERLFETYERAFGEGRVNQAQNIKKSSELRARYGEKYPKNLLEFAQRNDEGKRLPNLAPSEEAVYTSDEMKVPCCYFRAKFGSNNRRIFACFTKDTNLSKEVQSARGHNAQRFKGNPKWWDTNHRKADIWKTTEKIVTRRTEETRDNISLETSRVEDEQVRQKQIQTDIPRRRGRPPKQSLGTEKNGFYEQSSAIFNATKPKRGRPSKQDPPKNEIDSLEKSVETTDEREIESNLIKRKRGRPRKRVLLVDGREEKKPGS